MNHFLQSFQHFVLPDIVPIEDRAGEVILIHTKLAPDEESFVDKMVQAFNWPEVQSSHQVYHSNHPANFQLLWSQKQIRLVLVFGIVPSDLGLYINLKPYQLTFLDPFYIYLTDSVEKIANHKENKAKIWKDLRSLQLIPESGT